MQLTYHFLFVILMLFSLLALCLSDIRVDLQKKIMKIFLTIFFFLYLDPNMPNDKALDRSTIFPSLLTEYYVTSVIKSILK